MAYKNPNDDKIKELLTVLEKGIKETLDSKRYKDFLNVQSKFHNYSYNNQMLIYLQRPDATNVAGYKTWQKFERHVLKGEKGISILAPNPYKYTKEVDVLDPRTGKPVIDPITNKVKTQKIELTGLSFRKVSVFDINQTDGKELPTICKELQGNSFSAKKIIAAIKNVSEVPIEEKTILSGAKGYYSSSENVIVLNKGMSLDQTAKTLIHEYTHSQLHGTEAAALMDRATKEVQAESVAYIVSNRFGVDTSSYSFDYLASWSSGKDIKELKESFETIQKTSSKIIDKMETYLSKELQLENSPVKITVLWSESNKLQEGQTFTYEEACETLENLDKEQQVLRKANDKYDYSKITVGQDLPYVPYLKTKLKIELSNGQTGECRYDLGESGYNSLSECIRKEAYIDIDKYIKQTQTKIVSQDNSIQSMKGKIIDMYSSELPSIKHITEKTANYIDTLNKTRGHVHTIKEIKEIHNDLGKKLEGNIDSSSSSAILKSDIEEFNSISEVIDDLKQSKLLLKQEQASEKQLSKVKDFELTQ